MIELYIDGRPAELADGTRVTLSASAPELTASPSPRRTGPIALPMSARNRAVMEFAEQPLGALPYNSRPHSGELRCGGTTLLAGEVELLGCQSGGGEAGHYTIRITEPQPKWIRAARQTALRDTELAVGGVYSVNGVAAGWSSVDPVKFLPVWRKRPKGGAIEHLAATDYHPFVRIRALLDAAVAPTGYRIESEFMDGAFFRSLYLSGNYPLDDDGLSVTPALGEALSFSALFAHSEPQIRLWQALEHLFDLRIHTDEVLGTIRVEPAGSWADASVETDWSGRIDTGRPVSIEEPGAGRGRPETYRYRLGGMAADGAPWSARPAGRAADGEPTVLTNPLLTAPTDVAGRVATAPSAWLVGVEDGAGEEDLNFAPVIVRYHGLQPITDNGSWGWPSAGARYPLATFDGPAPDGLSLHFADRDGRRGLNRFYGPRYRWLDGGRILTLYLRLLPADWESALDFRGRYVLSLRGERLYGRLAAIDDYDPAAASTRCVFHI